MLVWVGLQGLELLVFCEKGVKPKTTVVSNILNKAASIVCRFA